jgi:hypothetical protein
MRWEPTTRRSFLLSGLALSGGALLAGCGGGDDKAIEVTKQEDPSIKGKSSMDFYKNNMLKKKAAAK